MKSQQSFVALGVALLVLMAAKVFWHEKPRPIPRLVDSWREQERLMQGFSRDLNLRSLEAKLCLFERELAEAELTVTEATPMSSLSIVLHPTAVCHDLMRVGDMLDGGKWVCGLSRMAENKSALTLYSFGSNYDISFETKLGFLVPTNAFVYDYSVNPAAYNGIPSLKVFAEGLDDHEYVSSTGARFRTLPRVRAQLGHNHVHILKMDVEGAEFRVLSKLLSEPQELEHYDQLLLEIHVGWDPTFTGDRIVEIFRQLRTRGFHVVHKEYNTFSIPENSCWEFTFIRVGSDLPVTFPCAKGTAVSWKGRI